MHKGIVLHDVALHHRAELLEPGPQDVAGDALAEVADVQLGGGLGPPPAHLHVHAPAVELVLVEVLDGLLRLGHAAHVDEAIVFHDVTLRDLPVLLEQLPQLLRRGGAGEVSDKNFHHGDVLRELKETAKNKIKTEAQS